MSTPCHARPGSCGSPGERADSSPKPRVVPGRFSLVVFDFDGTLADTFELFVHAQRRLARQFGFRPIETADLEQARGRSAMALMRASGLARWKLPLVASAFRRIMRMEGAAVHCFPGVGRVLEALHGNGIKLALVSSNSSHNCRMVLGAASWSLLGHTECGASLFGKHRRLLRAADRLGVPPGQAIYVGDHPTDADAARAAGMAFGAVTWGYATRQAFGDAPRDALFNHPDELLSLGTAQGRPWTSSP